MSKCVERPISYILSRGSKRLLKGHKKLSPAHFDTTPDFLFYSVFEICKFFQNGSHKYFERSVDRNDVITKQILPLALWSKTPLVTPPNALKLKNREKMKHPNVH